MVSDHQTTHISGGRERKGVGRRELCRVPVLRTFTDIEDVDHRTRGIFVRASPLRVSL